MATVKAAILGMGRTGASAALALRRYNQQKEAKHVFELTCADTRAGIREDAAKVGLDKIERDPFNAVVERDIVVIALPYADVEAAYKNIVPQMRAGAVLLDASPLKLPSLEWARRHLPSEAHLVGITPILNPHYLFEGLDDTLNARADLFDKGMMLLSPDANCIPEAVELASDFALLLGAAPRFVDPVEHDSLVAMTEGLPALLGLAAFYTAAKSQGWDDARRFTNPSFGRLTHHLYDTHPDDLRDALLYNRENLTRHLDDLLRVLKDFRDLLAHNNRDALEAAVVESSEAYSAWINRRHSGRWDDSMQAADAPSIGDMVMSGFMGGFITRRLRGNKNSDENK